MRIPAASAREQLAALPADAGLLSAWPQVSVDAAREAAVLVLFGERAAIRSADDPRDLDVLLLARATTLRSHAGQVAFPGGHREPGDRDLVATALREAEEETGVDPAGVDVLGTLRSLPMPYSSNVVTPVLAWWQHPSPVRALDAAESSLVFRTPVADLVTPEHRYTTLLRRDGQTWRGPAWLIEVEGTEQLVWGFTAQILSAMLDRLGWAEPWDPDRTLELPPPTGRP